ncbi:hypothetical protein shim_11080 [Shimia sp. SK013]|nr:hypothetical protein shim_11080 [Shimia sp. SK013]
MTVEIELERKFARFGDGLSVADGTKIEGYESFLARPTVAEMWCAKERMRHPLRR